MSHRAIKDPARLHALIDAMLLIGEEASLDELLQRIVATATELVGARYVALGVLDERGTGLRAFVTSGLSDDERAAIGPLPSGKGVLGRVITERASVRIEDLTTSPDSVGFPANHPSMRGFLGVPVWIGTDVVFGNLYLCDRLDGRAFTEDDEFLVEALGRAAGLVIANARLRDRLKDATLAEERARMARDLHDAVIQRLFAIGLSLQALGGETLREAVRQRIQDSVDELDTTIREIRTTIFEISDRPHEDGGLRGELRAIVDEVTARLGLRVALEFSGPLDAAVGPEAASHVVHVVRELLSNVVRHAEASRATVSVEVADGIVTVRVADDGLGPGGWHTDGHGLSNLRERAAARSGSVEVDERGGGGTLVTWTGLA